MKMKKISKMKNNCTSMWNRGHFDRKAQAALALAVSLWIAGGGVVVAGQITTVETDYTGEVNGNHSGDNWGDRTGDPNDNEVTVNAAVKVTGDVRGGYYFNKDGKVTNNIVTIFFRVSCIHPRNLNFFARTITWITFIDFNFFFNCSIE